MKAEIPKNPKGFKVRKNNRTSKLRKTMVF